MGDAVFVEDGITFDPLCCQAWQSLSAQRRLRVYTGYI